MNPSIRVWSSGPSPISSKRPSVAGVVMLFHSSIERMKKTLPDAVDGESDPKTANCRAHHGAMTSANAATQPAAEANEIAGGLVPAERQDRHRSQAKARPSAARTSRPSFRDSVARPANSPAPTNAHGDEPRSARAPSHSEPMTNGWKSEKLSGWTR